MTPHSIQAMAGRDLSCGWQVVARTRAFGLPGERMIPTQICLEQSPAQRRWPDRRTITSDSGGAACRLCEALTPR